MKYVIIVLFAAVTFIGCSKISPTKSEPPPIRSGDGSLPPVSLSLTMTSTGQIGTGLSKVKADSFTYPIKTWFPSAFYATCPEYVKMNLSSISAWGNWRYINFHSDTIPVKVRVGDTLTSDSVIFWDSIATTNDTIFREEYKTLWSGSKEITFDGSPVSLTNFDTLHIPEGILYTLRVEAEAKGKIKGSITGFFTFGKNGDSTISMEKTYYTKANYAWDGQTNDGGSVDPSVFETGPAEEMDICLMQYDTTITDEKGSGQSPYLMFDNPCSTMVEDSLKLTMLFDISRILTFFDGDTVNKNQAPSGGPFDKAYFTAHEAFCGSNNVSIAAVFVGEVGSIEGYSAEFVWSQSANTTDADSAGPALQSDTTYGGKGWLTIVLDASGNVIGGKMFQDNASFCPKGDLVNFNAAAQQFDLGLNPAVYHVYGFTRGTALGDYCFCRVFMPAWSVTGEQSCNARSGEIKYTLALYQH